MIRVSNLYFFTQVFAFPDYIFKCSP